MSKHPPNNFVKGRWVLTVNRDKEGKFVKCKARWVLKVFKTNRSLTNKLIRILPPDLASEWHASSQPIKGGIFFSYWSQDCISARWILWCVSKCNLSASSGSRISSSHRSASETTCIWTQWRSPKVVESAWHITAQLRHDSNKIWSLLLCCSFTNLG